MMQRAFIVGGALILALVSWYWTISPAVARTGNGYLEDQGISFYYAIIPAEMVRGHPARHPEATMHGGVPKGRKMHHVMVALFKTSSLERIVDADVTATIGEVGLAGLRIKLEPFTVNGALTYGNYFETQPNTNYRIRVEAKTPGSKQAARVEFEFRHP